MIGVDKEEEKKHPFYKVKNMAEEGKRFNDFLSNFTNIAQEKQAPLRAPIDSSLQDVN